MKGEDYKVVDATSDDVEKTSKLLEDTWLATYPNKHAGITYEDIQERFSSPEIKESIERRKNTINTNPDKHSWVIRDGDEVVGMCEVMREEGKGWLRALYVSPPLQGKGLGKKLFEQALEWLGSENPIFIHAAEYNLKAINFYKSFGFKETGIEVNSSLSPLPSGKVIPEIELARL